MLINANIYKKFRPNFSQCFMDFAGRLKAANRRLKETKVGVSLEVIGDRLWARATFPPKPDSTKQRPHQQRLALGLHANAVGLQSAVSKAKLIGA
jgi:hypothetical protein